MSKLVLVSGVLLFLAGSVGVVYGVGVNVPGMVARGATNYSGITASIAEWLLIMLAGSLLVAKSLRFK
jgi:hypothetical protein